MRERLKDKKNRDYLSLTFENLKRKIVVFPNFCPWRWAELKIGDFYKIVYSCKENTLRYGILISFKKLKETIEEESYFPLENGEIKYDFNFDNNSPSSLNESSSKKESMNPSENIQNNLKEDLGNVK